MAPSCKSGPKAQRLEVRLICRDSSAERVSRAGLAQGIAAAPSRHGVEADARQSRAASDVSKSVVSIDPKISQELTPDLIDHN